MAKMVAPKSFERNLENITFRFFLFSVGWKSMGLIVEVENHKKDISV